MAAEAWIVECTGCKCLITCCAIDPQEEHGKLDPPACPIQSAVLNCPCCASDYRYSGADIRRGRPQRNSLCQSRPPKSQPQSQSKLDGALLISASIVAAIRLRAEPVTRSPKVVATVADSIQLARMVMARLEG